MSTALLRTAGSNISGSMATSKLGMALKALTALQTLASLRLASLVASRMLQVSSLLPRQVCGQLLPVHLLACS